MDKVIIFDTSLRDGEQSPGVALTTTDKLEIAHQLAKLGVDVIEAGFPRTSPGDLEAVQAVAREVRGCQIAGLAHANPDAVDDCWAAVKGAEAPRIHVFLSSSDIDKARISVHCHNDLGMAVANSLAAVQVGARQIETCVNGIGERAGNASLEEVAMAIKTRRDFFGVDTNINTKELYRTSRLVADLTGMSIQPNKAIVGPNAFRHQSGIHQDGILKMRETYEIMDAKDIGWPTGGAEIILGKVSGRHGFKARLVELGYELTEEELSRAFLAFKELADKKAEIDDRDLEALVADRLRTTAEIYRLDFVQVSCGDHAAPTATVRVIAPDGVVRADAAIGTGPVDAVYRAINRIIDVPNELTEFSVKSVTEGIDAQGEVTIRIESAGKSYVGRGADTDIIVASAKAYMNALNRMLAIERRSE